MKNFSNFKKKHVNRSLQEELRVKILQNVEPQKHVRLALEQAIDVCELESQEKTLLIRNEQLSELNG